MTNSDKGDLTRDPSDEGHLTPIQVRVSDALLVAVDELRGDRSRAEFFKRAGEQVVAGEAVKQFKSDLLIPLHDSEPDRRLWKPKVHRSWMDETPEQRANRKAECSHPHRQIKPYGTVCADCHSVLELLPQPDVNPNFKP